MKYERNISPSVFGAQDFDDLKEAQTYARGADDMLNFICRNLPAVVAVRRKTEVQSERNFETDELEVRVVSRVFFKLPG